MLARNYENETRRDKSMKNTIYIRTGLVIGIISIVISALCYGTSIYTDWLKDGHTCQTNKTCKIDFWKQANDTTKTWTTSKVKMCKGKVYVSLNQTNGAKNTSYTIYAKKEGASKYTKIKTITIKSNNVESAKYLAFNAKNNMGYYYIQVVKNNKNKTASRLQIRLRV